MSAPITGATAGEGHKEGTMARPSFGPSRWAIAAAVAGIFAVAAPPAHASHLQYEVGEIFAGVGAGIVNRYSPLPGHALNEQLATLSDSLEETGMCFDGNTPLANLRTTNFQANNMTRFNNNGAVVQFPWAGPFNASPESCVVSIDPVTMQSVVYVGQADGTGDVLKFDLEGTLLASYDVAVQNRGSDWIDLAADRCTLFYTSEGDLVKRFDVCNNMQLPDFASALPLDECYALRIRFNGEVLVACTDAVVRFSPAGTILQTYPKHTDEADSLLFALTLDPSAEHFWTAGFITGVIYKYDITTGVIVDSFQAEIEGLFLSGLAIFGEPIASLPPTEEESTPGKATGGGFIDPVTGDVVGLATMLIQSGSLTASVNEKATFGHVVQFKVGDAAPKGNLSYNDHGAGVTIKVPTWNLEAIGDGTLPGCKHATLKGVGSVNGTGNHSIRVEVDDCGEPGSLAMDRFEIHVDEVGYFAIGVLDGGNIQIHES